MILTDFAKSFETPLQSNSFVPTLKHVGNERATGLGVNEGNEAVFHTVNSSYSDSCSGFVGREADDAFS